MKQLIATIVISTAVIWGCSSAKQATQAQTIIDTYGQEEQLTDTFLHRLQQENEIILTAYTEALAWGRHYNYTVAVRNNGTWKGYTYAIHGTLNNLKAEITEVQVDAKAADNALLFLNKPALWQGKDNHETCNMQVSDGSSNYLLLASKTRVLKLSYYMPEAYQRNCPDNTRQLFIDAFGKVRALGGKTN